MAVVQVNDDQQPTSPSFFHAIVSDMGPIGGCLLVSDENVGRKCSRHDLAKRECRSVGASTARLMDGARFRPECKY